MSNEIGEFIRKKRKEAKLTLKELSEGAGISFPYLSTIETGKRDTPSADVLTNIASVLGISSIEILNVAGYLTSKELEEKAEKEDRKWKLYQLSPLEMLTEVQPLVLKNIFISYVKNVDLNIDDYDLMNVSEEFLKKITPKEYVDLLIINHKDLLHIYVFLAALTQITGSNIPADIIWKWTENSKGNTDVIEKELDFDAFGIWYKLYFTDNFLDEYGDYELLNTREYTFDLTSITESDTVVFKGKILSPKVLKSLRVLLENIH